MENQRNITEDRTGSTIPIRPYKLEGYKLTYEMPKELDHHVAQDLCRELDMLVESFQIVELVLDFAATEFMDSSGIGVVIGRSKTMQFRRGALYVAHLGERVNTVFQAAGLLKIVQVKEV